MMSNLRFFFLLLVFSFGFLIASGKVHAANINLVLNTGTDPTQYIAFGFNVTTNPLPTNNSVYAPDNSLTAFQVPLAYTGYSQRNYIIPYDNLPYTVSFFIKHVVGATSITTGTFGFAPANSCAVYAGNIFDFNSLTPSGPFQSVYVGNGWYRISATFTRLTTCSSTALVVRLDLAQGLQLWGLQVEQNSYATNLQLTPTTFFIPSYPVTTTFDPSVLNVLNSINSKLGTENTNSAQINTSTAATKLSVDALKTDLAATKTSVDAVQTKTALAADLALLVGCVVSMFIGIRTGMAS